MLIYILVKTYQKHDSTAAQTNTLSCLSWLLSYRQRTLKATLVFFLQLSQLNRLSDTCFPWELTALLNVWLIKLCAGVLVWCCWWCRTHAVPTNACIYLFEFALSMFSKSSRGLRMQETILKGVSWCVGLCVLVCKGLYMSVSLWDCQKGSLAGGITAVGVEKVRCPSGEKYWGRCLLWK